MIVVGCGRVGSELALKLIQGGHDTTVIDKEVRAFRRLPDNWGGKTIVGFGFDRDVLEEANVKITDALAAVTSGDNTNILTARIARETYDIANVVARIYDPRRAVIYQRLGISTVATVTWTTEQAMRRLFPNQNVQEWSDPSGEVLLVERSLPNRWAGRRLEGLNKDGSVKVVTYSRANITRLVTPEIVGQEGDILHLAVSKSKVKELEISLEGEGNHK